MPEPEPEFCSGIELEITSIVTAGYGPTDLGTALRLFLLDAGCVRLFSHAGRSLG